MVTSGVSSLLEIRYNFAGILQVTACWSEHILLSKGLPTAGRRKLVRVLSKETGSWYCVFGLRPSTRTTTRGT